VFVELHTYIHIKLLEYVHYKNVLFKEQFGFRSNWSTEAAIYSLISEIFFALNNKILI